jgi:hypothetical protein
MHFDSGAAAALAISVRQIELNGYDLITDSFNSADANQSTDGLYDPLRAGDRGDVALESGIFNSINVGNVGIWGRLGTAPEFTLTLGPLGSVGSSWWHLDGQLGIEPGFHDTNFVWMFPDVRLPFVVGLAPASGVYNGGFYQYILNDGDYQMPSLTMSGNQKLIVDGTSRLIVMGDVTLSGNASILILPTASLQLYVAGSTANLRGEGVINQGPAKDFMYFGAGQNREVNLRLGIPLRGFVYAPSAVCTIFSAGSTAAEVHGAVFANSLELGADLEVHLDEAP